MEPYSTGKLNRVALNVGPSFETAGVATMVSVCGGGGEGGRGQVHRRGVTRKTQCYDGSSSDLRTCS
jgi:hypothetical protein